jgi:hypothetical protein
MRPAPEFASGEVVLASTYRAVGFGNSPIKEGKVPANGRAFQKRLERGNPRNAKESTSGIPNEAWKRIILGTLRSPKQPNQAAKRFLQISPVVPDAALYSLSARLSTNSWNPGELVSKVILFGSSDLASASQIWKRLFHALDVTEKDDIWARFLNTEFRSWRSEDQKECWSPPSSLNQDKVVEIWHRTRITIPATQFVRDLDCILTLKNRLTRRQWTSVLEAILRLGTAAHILWICRANAIFSKALWSVIQGDSAPEINTFRNSLGTRDSFWRFGQVATGAINDLATNFLKSRAALNLFLYLVKDSYPEISKCLQTPDCFVAFLAWVSENRKDPSLIQFRTLFEELLEDEQRAISGKKGIASNVREFIRHVLGQRQTAEPCLDNYDQGYFLGKRGTHRSAPWVVSLGPVAVLAIVHACTHEAKTPRTIDDLCCHLARYGLEVRPQDVPESRLGTTLRNLGLVLDSPDAEGGMVVKNPFAQLGESPTPWNKS